MIRISRTVKCAYCGKESHPYSMRYGTVVLMERRLNLKKRKYEMFVTKFQGFYCGNCKGGKREERQKPVKKTAGAPESTST